jgi:hypothetical protein
MNIFTLFHPIIYKNAASGAELTPQRLEFKDINMYKVATSKKKFYSYETEYRALITRQYTKYGENPPEPKFSIGAEVEVDLETLIDKIYISPFVDDWFCRIIDSTISKSEFLKSFDKKNIIRSSIKVLSS